MEVEGTIQLPNRHPVPLKMALGNRKQPHKANRYETETTPNTWRPGLAAGGDTGC